jgi:hypothetical protein
VNAIHRKIIKKAALGDKEGEGLLMQLYYDTPAEGRADLLKEMMNASGACAGQIKSVLMEQLEIEEACRAQIYEKVEDYKEKLRRESPGGPDEEAGEGGTTG